MSKTLSRKELSLIGREGERIKIGLSNLVDAFPNHAKTITGMSKWLGANKSTCQRMVETINKADTGLEVIDSLPGPAGIKGFIKLAESKGSNESLLEEARSVVQRFENLIYDFSRSHSALKKLIRESSSVKETTNSKRDNRAALFESVKKITGETMESSFAAFILKESEQDSNYIQQFTLTYYDSCETSEHSRPLMMPIAPVENKILSGEPDIVSQEQVKGSNLPLFSVIKEFTSSSITENLDKFELDGDVMVIPTKLGRSNLNFGAIQHYPKLQQSPFHGGKKVSCVGLQTRYPTRIQYIACFLEKTFAMRSVANAGVYAGGSDIAGISSSDLLWYDRFHDEADLRLSEPYDDFNEKLDYPLANELVDNLFSMSGCQRDQYTCFLMKVEYPIWSATYRMFFQYAVD
ncbi:hypothetical protein [Kangiella sediminilitoris]|uniref:Uncharacterized protein n=1 Tax=Kangiella sediminilitoris TaxID=1144748 RepID=A0A1B3BAF4_9GAMM|nr:hypothetical protein [Kangiella sediminilitoris]AOE49763.1 hypothetical protein KS2013_1043 [Kangiella sediminilitoris]